MKFEDFKKLKTEIKDKNFFNNYQGFSKLSYFLSYVGNVFSILFAYFFINDIIMSTLINPTPSIITMAVIASIVILTTLELVKRFVFDKFSQSAIKEKFKFKELETIVLGFVCGLLITTSFYFSLNGAHKFADKKDDIKESVTIEVATYSDSLNRKFDVKIEELESQNKILFETNQGYEARLLSLGQRYGDETNSYGEKIRIKSELAQVRKDKEINSESIDKNEIKIKEIKEEKKSDVDKFEANQSLSAEKKIEDTSQNPFIFLIFSTVIEVIILFGIWFINYYKFRSVEDYERKIAKDPNYKTFNNWNLFLDVIYNNDTKIGDLLPYKNELMKILKANNVDLSAKEMDDMLKVFLHINILKAKGNKKAIATLKEDASEIIKTHLKVE